MNVLESIKELAKARLGGTTALGEVLITFDDVKDQYLSCDLFQKVVAIKFDLNKLKTTGYSLQEVLDLGQGLMQEETEKLVYLKLQEYINKINYDHA